MKFLFLKMFCAMDGVSADEKTAVFQKVKGRNNNYPSKAGVHQEKKKRRTQTCPPNDWTRDSDCEVQILWPHYFRRRVQHSRRHCCVGALLDEDE